MKSLACETFIVYGRPQGPGQHGLGQYEAMIAACHAAGFSPRIGQETPRISSTLNLVAVGLGISLIPASLARMNMDGVAYRRLKGKDSAEGHTKSRITPRRPFSRRSTLFELGSAVRNSFIRSAS